VSWRADLVARLRGDAGLAATFGTRIAFFEAARSWTIYPQLVCQEISPGREYTHNGPDGLDGPRVQFDIYADDEADIWAGEAALLAEIESAATQGGTRFHEGYLQGRSMPDPEDLGNNRTLLRLRMDFIFYHEST
jgi:hypothetical protein